MVQSAWEILHSQFHGCSTWVMFKYQTSGLACMPTPNSWHRCVPAGGSPGYSLTLWGGKRRGHWSKTLDGISIYPRALLLTGGGMMLVKMRSVRWPGIPPGTQLLGLVLGWCWPVRSLPGQACCRWLSSGYQSRRTQVQGLGIRRWIICDIKNDTLNWFQIQGCFVMVLALIVSHSFMLQMFFSQIKRPNSHQTPVQCNYCKSL